MLFNIHKATKISIGDIRIFMAFYQPVQIIDLTKNKIKCDIKTTGLFY